MNMLEQFRRMSPIDLRAQFSDGHQWSISTRGRSSTEAQMFLARSQMDANILQRKKCKFFLSFKRYESLTLSGFPKAAATKALVVLRKSEGTLSLGTFVSNVKVGIAFCRNRANNASGRRVKVILYVYDAGTMLFTQTRLRSTKSTSAWRAPRQRCLHYCSPRKIFIDIKMWWNFSK